jgi:hypothetical protein
MENIARYEDAPVSKTAPDRVLILKDGSIVYAYTEEEVQNYITQGLLEDPFKRNI